MTQWIVSSSVLILVIIALRFFLRRRVKPLLQYGIWALVLVRLLLPFQLGSTPISIENAVEKAPLVQEMSYAQQVTHFDYHPDGSATGYYTFSPVLDHDSGTHNEPVPELFTHAEADRITNLRTAKQYLTSLWVGGMIAMGAVFLISNGVFALRLKNSRKRSMAVGLLRLSRRANRCYYIHFQHVNAENCSLLYLQCTFCGGNIIPY